jgi:hypothetical protein
MAEETNKVEETVQETVQEQVEETPQAEEKPSNVTVDEDGTIKLDLRQQEQKQETDAVQEQSTDEVSVRDESGVSEGVSEQNVEEANEEPTGESNTDNDEVLELVQDEEVIEEEATLANKIKDIPNKLKEEAEDVNNNQETRELPENVDKLVKFMEETGGSVEDYVNLNKNYDNMEDMELLREYYQQTKPHLAVDEIDFLIEDNFSYDEEVDEERDIRRKKLAFKESIAEAKSNLTNLKDKYYEDLKLSSKLSPDQKEAVEFYNDYRTSQESTQKQRSIFEQKTNDLFTNEFKGFEYKIGDLKYRYNVKDIDKVKNTQADINTLVSKYVNDNNEMTDAKGYHKALFTAMNSDAIANHFYEQGKADAIKNQMQTSKNIDMAPRGSHEKVTTNSGMQVKAISGDDMGRLRFKIKN